MSRLWSALVGLAAADAATTLLALRMGLPEANPLLAALVGAVGLVAIPVSQLLYVGVARLLVAHTDGARRAVLLAGIVPSSIVVANNLAAVLAVGWSA